MKLDITITASVRADILRMTLHSFRKNLLNQFDARVIINVDPRGELETHTQMDIVEIAREYFDDVIYRTPTVSSFPSAVQWCWEQVETNFFFHLEDDWILRRRVDGAAWLELFNDPKVVGATLNRLTKQSTTRWLHRAGAELKVYDNQFFIYPQVTLNPSFFRTTHLKPRAAKLAPDLDPEYQLIKLRGDGTFLYRTKNPPIIIDTGTLWRKRRAIEKSHAAEGETYAPSVKQSGWRVAMLTARFYVRKWIWKIRYCQ